MKNIQTIKYLYVISKCILLVLFKLKYINPLCKYIYETKLNSRVAIINSKKKK